MHYWCTTAVCNLTTIPNIKYLFLFVNTCCLHVNLPPELSTRPHHFACDDRASQGMGLKNYRLSIAMPRVLPGATGPPNEDGIAFYNRLIDCLIAADITPCVRGNTKISIAASESEI